MTGDSSADRAAFRSAVDGLAWPAQADALGMSVLGLNYQFLRTERLAPAALRALQFRQLGALLDHAASQVPFYADALAAAGFKPGAPLDETVWRRIPILTRRELQQNRAALTARAIPNFHGNVAEFESSGSTGMPVKGGATEISSLFWEAVILRSFLWQRYDLRAGYATIRHPREVAAGAKGVRGAVWSLGAGAAFATGPSHLFDVRRPIAEQLAWLIETDPDYLIAYPSVLRELVLESRRRGARPRRLKGATAFGEQLPGDLRTLLADHWQVRLDDTYSAVETGYVALQCPENAHYHVQSETVLVEILDAAGRPCAAGEIGRVIVTPLHNFAMPLLRYEIGDYAEAGGACTCGRTLPVLTRIMGRVHNLMALPDGGAMWPSVQFPIAYAGLPIVQFQVVQKTPRHVEVKLVAAARLASAEEDALRRRLIETNNWPDIDIAVTYHDALPRGAGGKFEEFYSEVAADHP